MQCVRLLTISRLFVELLPFETYKFCLDHTSGTLQGFDWKLHGMIDGSDEKWGVMIDKAASGGGVWGGHVAWPAFSTWIAWLTGGVQSSLCRRSTQL